MSQSKANAKHHKGWIPIPDTRWKVLTIEKDKFVEVGEVFVSGKKVAREMDSHRSIKGYEPYDIAKQLAHQKYPKANPIVIERVET